MTTLQFCSCRKCKRGRDTSFAQYLIIHKKRSSRQRNKALIKTGDYDKIVNKISVTYTD